MQIRCGCEDGGNCTKTTVCAIDTAVEDATEALTARVAELEAALKNIAALDYKTAAMTGACGMAVKIAMEALAAQENQE